MTLFAQRDVYGQLASFPITAQAATSRFVEFGHSCPGPVQGLSADYRQLPARDSQIVVATSGWLFESGRTSVYEVGKRLVDLLENRPMGRVPARNRVACTNV